MKTFDRYPYLKHSTAMPFMPAVKATEQPAGQVVNEEPTHKALSGYIRSINRAQAFDDVAQEKKISFDKWYQQNRDASPAQIWDAALKYGKL